MNNILIIKNHANDKHVTEFAYQFALQNGNNIIEAQMSKPLPVRSLSYHPVRNQSNRLNLAADKFQPDSHTFSDFGKERYQPRVKTIDASRFTERDLAAYIRHENCSMVLSTLKDCRLNLQVVLNQVSCPVMLLPDDFGARQIKRIVYLTDLRYCQQEVVSHLSKLKESSVLLAHICQQGLPDVTPEYGNQLFNDTLGRYSACCELFFSQIKETNLEKVVDTLVNTMRADMLVCVNRMFHFQKLVGDKLPKSLPDHVSVPLLIFPC
jgi:hypothetical protein